MPATGKPGAVADALAIVRYHIVLIAMTATLVFGWLMTGQGPFLASPTTPSLLALALIVGLDWFLINLLNRVTDLEEDLANGIQGTERVAGAKRAVAIGSALLLVGSFATHLVFPAITPLRVVVQIIGMAYNYRLVPTLSGMKRLAAAVPPVRALRALPSGPTEASTRVVMKRLKELYFFKNFGSACLFVLTCFGYPLAASGWRPGMSWPAIATLVVFFVLYEITFEILYDLRDLEGDRREGIPTYPVVHGQKTSLRIIDALLALATLTLIVGLATGTLGVREGLMLAAPALQRVFYPARVARGLTSADCIALTHLGTGELVLFLVGTAIWSAAGLPDDIFLV